MAVYFRPHGEITTAPAPRSLADEVFIAELAARLDITISIDQHVDYEDWMEPACMALEALRAGLEFHVLPARPLREAVQRPEYSVAGKPCRDFMIGRQKTSDPFERTYFDFGWPAANTDIANHYAELETFQARAGRRLQLADMPGDREAAGTRQPFFGEGLSSTSLGAAMTAIGGPVIVKQVYPGKALPLLRYDLEETTSEREAESLWLNEVGFHFCRFEGDPAALLVQERITMTHETRVFVISGEVVTAAACIETHTPRQGPEGTTGAIASSVFEIKRNSGKLDRRARAKRDATRDALLAFARETVADISAEAPELQHYTLDVALDGQGRPIVIELNPADNAGLYAINAARLFKAIHAAAEAAPSRTPQDWDPKGYLAEVDARPEGGLDPFGALRAAALGDESYADIFDDEDEAFEDGETITLTDFDDL